MEDKMAYEEGVLLYDSIICRLCGVENSEGIYLYDSENDLDFKTLINRYLPLEIEDDGKLPRTICPGCNIQLESTIQFFDLLVEGQKKLRELWKLEVIARKRLEKEKNLVESLPENGKICLPSEEEDDTNLEQGVLIKILPDGNFFTSEHEMTLQVNGLDKPKRKRGRPKKVKVDAETEELDQNAEAESQKEKEEEEDKSDYDENGRKKRRRKVPQRFMEAVQGKELDRILREEGAIDGNESDDVGEEESVAVENKTESKSEVVEEAVGEVIGHIETPDGNIAEQIIAPAAGRGQYKRKKLTKFACDFCGQSFKDRTKWIRHRISHKGMKFQCLQENCLKKFSSRNKLKLHQKTTAHEGEEIIENELEPFKHKKITKLKSICKYCEKNFSSNILLSDHISNEHPGEINDVQVEEKENEDQSSEDNTFTDSFKVLYNVLAGDKEMKEETNEEKEEKKKFKKENSGKLHACDECDRTFNHPSSLMYHKESVHNDGRRFVCSKCGKSFTHKQLLQRHQMVHSDSRPFQCPDCGIRFKTKSNLFNHKVVHTGEKKFSCQICNQQFAHKTSLTLHLRWHKGHRPFQCPVCQKRFTQNGNLREHMRIHSGTKPYGCEYCGKHFTTSSQHKLHVKRHTGDRPWKCSHCGKSFLHKDTWKTHERRHTGEKPFQCTFCMRGFAEHWSLKKHVRLHTGEKPYKCLTCGKEFADCSNLTKHRKVHSGVPGPKIDNTVWSIIKSHLIDGITQSEQPEDVQQIIYVTYQDNEDGNDGKTLHLVDNIPEVNSEEMPFETDKGILEMNPEETNQTVNYKMEPNETNLQAHVGVTDEEGNPVQLTMPDGKAIEIVSMDMDSHVVQVRTLEGPRVFVQLPKNQEISEAELVERIQEAVLEETPKPKFQKSILLPNVQRDLEESGIEVTGQVLTEDMLNSAQIISEEDNIRLENEGGKPLELVSEFEKIMNKKINEYLATQQCSTLTQS